MGVKAAVALQKEVSIVNFLVLLLVFDFVFVLDCQSKFLFCFFLHRFLVLYFFSTQFSFILWAFCRNFICQSLKADN